MQPAMFAHTLENGKVECQLCAHYCQLKPGQTGICQVRHNEGGTLVTSSYGQAVFLAAEPIEKKYFFHVLPGAQALSLGTPGCNLGCKYCINWRVSQRGLDGTEQAMLPASIVDEALAQRVGCIAFTYTEPTIFFEYARDIAERAHQAGLVVVAKSNGYMAPDVLQEMVPWLDAINIDLKGWRDETHRRIVGGAVAPVLQNMRRAVELGLWLEVTTLVVPGLNDTQEDLDNSARFIANELGIDTPWHLLRFYPHYKMLEQKVTSQAVLQRAVESGQKAGLRNIYTKELRQGQMLHTFCTHCHALLIERKGYNVISTHLRNGHCEQCGTLLKGIGLNRENTYSAL